MTAEIELLHGRVVLIDREDLGLVQQHRWRAVVSNSYTAYAITNIRRADGRYVTLSIHRLLLGLTDPAVHVDHLNGNGLDNRRANLRICNRNENMWNRRKNSGNTSGYKGVCWHTPSGKWRAQIGLTGKRHHLGYFTTAEEAHAAYCRAADALHGNFKNYGDSP